MNDQFICKEWNKISLDINENSKFTIRIILHRTKIKK